MTISLGCIVMLALIVSILLIGLKVRQQRRQLKDLQRKSRGRKLTEME